MGGTNIINENTLIPISLLIIVIGFVVWLVKLHGNVSTLKTRMDGHDNRVEKGRHEERITVLETLIASFRDILTEIKEDIKEIKNRLTNH